MSFTPPGEQPPEPSAPPPAPPVPGWWLASDGNWYPPEAAPGNAPPPYGAAPAYGAPPAYGPPPGAYGGPPPMYGPPPAGYGPTPYGYTPFQPVQGTNGLAIASLVLGIVWVYWIGSILAVIFGFVALSQIRQRNQSGRGMAIAGIILGFAELAIFVVAVIAVAASGSS